MTIKELRIDFRKRFVGNFGIFGIGMSNSKKSLKFFVDEKDSSWKEVIEDIKKESKPYHINIVPGKKPPIGTMIEGRFVSGGTRTTKKDKVKFSK